VYSDFSEAIEMYAANTGVTEEIVLESIKKAFIESYKRQFKKDNIIVEIDKDEKDIALYLNKKVVEKVESPLEEISITDAKKIKNDVNLNDIIKVKINPSDLGRITAQMVHQIIMENITDAKVNLLYEELNSKLGEIVTGTLQRKLKFNDIIVNLGKIEAILPLSEQMPKDKSKIGEKVRLLLKKVEKIDKKIKKEKSRVEDILKVTVSRADQNFVIKLFEADVPEILDGIVVIKGIAREPGERTKIAVSSSVENIDPVGACVGMKGVRIQSIIRELDGEKIDIIRWDNNIAKFIINLLSPAKVLNVKINLNEKTALVIVPNDQLPTAIGKDGINVKLASKLLNWTIDIKSLSEFEKMMEDEETKKKIEELFTEPLIQEKQIEKEEKKEIEKTKPKIETMPKEQEEEEEIEETSIFELPDVPYNILKKLKDNGYDTIESIIDLKFEDLIKIPGIDKKNAQLILKSLNENVKVIEE
jgi:N utilization substance protein A